MLITRTSPFSGEENTRDIPVTQEQINDWQRGALIQNAMPNVSADDREFLMTGITPEEWEESFGPKPEELAVDTATLGVIQEESMEDLHDEYGQYCVAVQKGRTEPDEDFEAYYRARCAQEE